MTHANADDSLRTAIRDVIQHRLGAHILDVLVDRDDESDDEPVLLVTVVIDDAEADLDEDHVLGLVRHLQPTLNAVGELSFPIISFLTEQELREAA